MWRIYRTSFSASHRIEGHPKCGEYHGHNYHVTVKMQIPSPHWFDFFWLKQIVEEILRPLDHTTLPDSLSTCEELAEHILKRLKEYVIAVDKLSPAAKHFIFISITRFSSLREKQQFVKARKDEGFFVIDFSNCSFKVTVFETDKYGVEVEETL